MRHILCVTLLSLGPDLPQVAMRLLGFLFVAARGAGEGGGRGRGREQAHGVQGKGDVATATADARALGEGLGRWERGQKGVSAKGIGTARRTRVDGGSGEAFECVSLKGMLHHQGARMMQHARGPSKLRALSPQKN